jgi:hypothetical protein
MGNDYSLSTFLNSSEQSSYKLALDLIHQNSRRETALLFAKLQDNPESIGNHLKMLAKIDEDREESMDQLSRWVDKKYEIWKNKPWNKLRIFLKLV